MHGRLFTDEMVKSPAYDLTCDLEKESQQGKGQAEQLLAADVAAREQVVMNRDQPPYVRGRAWLQGVLTAAISWPSDFIGINAVTIKLTGLGVEDELNCILTTDLGRLTRSMGSGKALNAGRR